MFSLGAYIRLSMPHCCAFPKWQKQASLTPAPVREDTEDQMTALRTNPSVEFLCSFCGKQKGDATDWHKEALA
jgi:hypothetical protein